MKKRDAMSDIIDGIPNITGIASERTSAPGRGKRGHYADISEIDFHQVTSSFGIALHMHQPTIPASTDDLRTAGLISNLQYMMEHMNIGDNHNAPVFLWCYGRISDFVRDLVAENRHPRVMLDYSGNLLWGLRQIEGGKVLDNLRLVTSDKRYHRNVEWLGTMWAHAVATSTPVPDLALQMSAWREHFAAIFGPTALERVKGFSPPEMHIPIHPDVCYAYVKALKECGYEWLMVQEHTIENPDGSGIRRPHYPHRLVAKNSLGESAAITLLIKTQGSDTKLVAQMQPYYEAKSRGREEFCGKSLAPFVLQIGDGENGGVMMNEFPAAYKIAFQEIGSSGAVAMNGSEYLEFVRCAGIDEESFPVVQPISQHRIWERVTDRSPGACDAAIEKVHAEDAGFNLDRGSWTNDRNWVKGYENILDPIRRLSVEFHKKYDGEDVDPSDAAYRKALLYLLISQSSDFRFWGQGAWTEYAREICRRGIEAVSSGRARRGSSSA